MTKFNLRFLKNKWIFPIVALFLIGLGIYSYCLSVRRVHFRENNNQYHEAFENAPASLKIFYADWCGHCKTFKPIYENDLPDMINKQKINCTIDAIDAEKNKEQASKYEVKGFPTTILELPDGKKIKYEGEREPKPIIDFIKEHL
jgi:thiol-disulfide isomerase/thioredoxin